MRAERKADERLMFVHLHEFKFAGNKSRILRIENNHGSIKKPRRMAGRCKARSAGTIRSVWGDGSGGVEHAPCSAAEILESDGRVASADEITGRSGCGLGSGDVELGAVIGG